MSKKITKFSSEEIQLPQHYLFSPPQCSWDTPSAEQCWKPLSRFGSVAIGRRGDTLAFLPRSLPPLPPPRPTLPCFNIHGSVYCSMLGTWHPLIGQTRLCQGFSITVSLWPSCKLCDETWWLAACWNYWWVLKEEVMRLQVMQISTHIRTGLCRGGFLLLFRKHFFLYLVKCWHWWGKEIVFDQI